MLVGTPDHWHALADDRGLEAGADVYVQKPISVDVVEGQAMLAAARKHNRVVQVGTQRRSTPHLIEARDQSSAPGKLGKVGLVEIYSYYGMGSGPARRQRPARIPGLGDVDRPGPDAALQPHEAPARLAVLDGIQQRHVGDMCIHMLDTARWMLDLGCAQACEFVRRQNHEPGPEGQYLRHADRDL